MSEKINTTQSEAGKPLRVGLIGVTGYALAYFEEINKLMDAGLVQWAAVTVINQQDAPEQMAFFKKHGVPVYDDYREMLKQERGRLDWLCIPTAIEWHARMSIDALSEGIPVLLEKPIAPTLQDVDAIQAAEKASGKTVAIGFQHQYCHSTWNIKQRLLEGDIGEIQRVDGLCLWPRARQYYNRNNWGGRIFVDDSWVLDSPLHNAISHLVNLILFLTGPSIGERADPKLVRAELYRSKPIQNFDTVRTEAVLDTGATAGIVLSHSSSGSVDPEIRITGSKGTFIWRFGGPHAFHIGDRTETLDAIDQIKVREQMFQNIHRRLTGDSSARICSTHQARGEVKWVNAVQDAAEIHNVPEQFISLRESPEGHLFDSIKGLDEVAVRAYREGCWFNELGVPWAVAPSELELTNYTEFKALQTESPVALQN